MNLTIQSRGKPSGTQDKSNLLHKKLHVSCNNITTLEARGDAVTFSRCFEFMYRMYEEIQYREEISATLDGGDYASRGKKDVAMIKSVRRNDARSSNRATQKYEIVRIVNKSCSSFSGLLSNPVLFKVSER